jgi:hypothetical protein
MRPAQRDAWIIGCSRRALRLSVPFPCLSIPNAQIFVFAIDGELISRLCASRKRKIPEKNAGVRE